MLRCSPSLCTFHQVRACNRSPSPPSFRKLPTSPREHASTTPCIFTENGAIKNMSRPDWGLERCITCYMCLAACPVYKRNTSLFLGPVGFVKLANMHFNSVDKADRVQMAVDGGVQLCETYGACQEVCPQHIRIVPTIHLLLKEAAYRELSDQRGLKCKLIDEMTHGFI